MLFEDCRPNVRYARELVLTPDALYGSSIPYDARLFYVRSGVGEILVEGRTYDMQAGSFLYFPAATQYRLLTPQENVTYLALNFDMTQDASRFVTPIPPDAPEDFHPARVFAPVQFDDAPMLNAPLYFASVPYLEPSLISVLTEYHKKLIHFRGRMSAVLFKILTDCIRNARAPGGSAGRPDGGEILEYIHTHYREPLSNDSVGHIFGFHKNYVSGLIKTLTGKPLHQYILYVRLSHAWEMLEDGEMTVAQIANACGFTDICYFSRYFKQVYGEAPSTFRKRDHRI